MNESMDVATNFILIANEDASTACVWRESEEGDDDVEEKRSSVFVSSSWEAPRPRPGQPRRQDVVRRCSLKFFR